MRNRILVLIGVVFLCLPVFSFAAITGVPGACVGGHSFLCVDSTSATAGGVWSSSNPSVASIGTSYSGYCTNVNGVSVGTATITFSAPGATYTVLYTVGTPPPAIVGGTSPMCIGTTTTLTNPSPGGIWSSLSSSVASIGSSSGVVTAIGSGVATIHYALTPGCYVSHNVTVSPTPHLDSVTGAPTLCPGATTTYYTPMTSSGTWSSSDPSVATVSASSGLVTGVSAGTALISCTISSSCGTSSDAAMVTVTTSISAGTLSGTTSLLIGGGYSYLYPTVPGGTWSSSTPSVATVSASTGAISPVSPGTTTISYTVTSGSCAPGVATLVVTVSDPSCISGDVLYTGPPHTHGVKVWLIKYNPGTHILSAVDSSYIYGSGTSAHYQFCGLGTDSFRIKAAIPDTVVSSGTGYVPTYHNSSVYWSTANVVYHTAGTSDVNKDITMALGTVTTGPGFIAGDVTSGANKGTADGVPVPDMLIFCVNNTTGEIVQFTKTDAAGHYSFSSLPVGVPYKIYPEDMNYATTPYPLITLTSGSTSMTAASFVQHTISYTITPIVVGVGNVNDANTSVSIYPNPAKGAINVQWNAVNVDNATAVMTDIAGRQVLNRKIDMTSNMGNVRINLDGIAAGFYIVSIKAKNVNYNAKVVVQ